MIALPSFCRQLEIGHNRLGHNAARNLAGTNLASGFDFHAEEPMVSIFVGYCTCAVPRLPSLFLAIELYLSPRVAIRFGLAF